MHNDSGAALEAIGFAYAAQSPLPNGHEWIFAVAGCIHPLPVDREGFVFVAVRGRGVNHGTLPTSSTEPHFAEHAGVGSALVNKADLVQLLNKRDEPGQLPWPTPEELKARREEVAGLQPLTGDGEATAAAEGEVEPEAEESPAAAAEGVPKSREELLLAIADPAREFGLLTKPEELATLATPAITALKAVCEARGLPVPEAAAQYRRGGGSRAGDPLPANMLVVKVRPRHVHPETVRSNDLTVSPKPTCPPRNCKVVDLTLSPKPTRPPRNCKVVDLTLSPKPAHFPGAFLEPWRCSRTR